MLQLRDSLLRQILAVAPLGTLPGQPLQLLLRGLAGLRLARILIAQLIEREPAAPDDLVCSGQRFRMPLEKARHLGRILEKAVRMPLETEAGIVDGAALADAGNDVLQHAARGMMIEDVTHRDGRHACGLSGLLDLPQAQMLVGSEAADQGHVGPVFEDALQAPQIELQGLIRMVAKQHCEQALVPGLHIVPGEAAFAFACPALAEAQQAAEAGIGGAIGGVDEKRCAVGRDRAGSRPRGARRFPSTAS